MAPLGIGEVAPGNVVDMLESIPQQDAGCDLGSTAASADHRYGHLAVNIDRVTNPVWQFGDVAMLRGQPYLPETPVSTRRQDKATRTMPIASGAAGLTLFTRRKVLHAQPTSRRNAVCGFLLNSIAALTP